MKKFEEMTRRELAEVIVDDQIRRGVIKAEGKEAHIKVRLNGIAGIRGWKWEELYKSVKEIFG